MSRAELDAFLAERTYCVLATTGADGRPQARPVAFTVLGGAIWFATVAGERLRNIEHTPWVSVVITEGEGGEHRAVAADGPVTLRDEPPAEMLDLWEQRFGSRAAWAVKWFELRPERLYSHRA
jgi:general stress protein 26